MASIPAILQQFLANTDPSKDYSKESLSQLQARTARIRKNYTAFFQYLLGGGIPAGGTEGQVLANFFV